MGNKYFSQLTQLAAGSVASGDAIAIEDISAGETKYITSADYATYVSSTLAASSGGWDAVADTWAYLGTTTGKGTVTVPAGGTLLYNKGDKVKLTQGGSQLYFYVIDASSGTTLVLTGGSDYALGTATISNVYYSKIENPQDFPDWFNWAPTHTGFSSNPAFSASFKISGKACFIRYYCTAPGASNSTAYTITTPVTSSAGATGSAQEVYDNSGYVANGLWSIAASSGTISLYKSALATWTGSNNKYANLEGFYPI